MKIPEYIQRDYIPVVPLDVLSKTASGLQQMHNQYVETKNKIVDTVDKMDFNNEEYKNGYVPTLKRQLMNWFNEAEESGFDGYRTEDVVSMGAELFTDPVLKGKLESQQAYKNNVKSILDREDLDDAQKEFMIYMNPYHADVDKDTIKDPDGNILKMKTWSPVYNVDKIIDYTPYFEKVKNLLNADQDLIKNFANFAPGTPGGFSQTNSGWETLKQLTKNKVENMLFSILDDAAMASLKAEYKLCNDVYTNNINVEEAEESGEVTNLRRMKYPGIAHWVIDGTGKKRSFDEFVKARFKGVVDGITFHQYDGRSTASGSYIRPDSVAGSGTPKFNINIDENGHVYLTTEGINVTGKPDEDKQPAPAPGGSGADTTES